MEMEKAFNPGERMPSKQVDGVCSRKMDGDVMWPLLNVMRGAKQALTGSLRKSKHFQ